MSRRSHSGFTLVELMITVTIVLMLVGLLTVAVGTARERARQGQCLNNMIQVGKAVQEFEASYNNYPGSLHATNRSWVTPLLGILQRQDLLDASGATVPNAHLDLLICPSDASKMSGSGATAPTSLVANMGRRDFVDVSGGMATDPTLPSDWRANAVFLNLVPGSDPDLRVKIEKQTAAYILKGDGLANTIMLSERIGASTWNTPGTYWGDFPESSCGVLFDPASAATEHLHEIGENFRYSSFHTEGSNVLFASGAAKFVSSEIANGVFCQLMTPNGAAAKEPGTNTNSPAFVGGSPAANSY